MPLTRTDHCESSESLRQEEQQLLQRRHSTRWAYWHLAKSGDTAPNNHASSPWTGIALSGGGIRSATFCLGALQALASRNILRYFDYISSVSGGGYSSASLQWWWNGRHSDHELAPPEFGVDSNNFPYGADTGTAASDVLSFLQSNCSYLTPGSGIDIWTAIAAVLRTIFLSAIVWLPIFCAAFIALIYAGRAFPLPSYIPSPLPSFLIDGRWLINCSKVDPTIAVNCALRLPEFAAVGVYASYFLTIMLALLSIATCYLSSIKDTNTLPIWVNAAALIAGAVLTLVAIKFHVLYNDVDLHWKDTAALYMVGSVGTFLSISSSFRFLGLLDHPYALLRTIDYYSGRLLRLAAFSLILGIIPVIPYQLTILGAGAESTSSLLIFVASALAVILALQAHSTSHSIETSIVNRVLIPGVTVVFFVCCMSFAYFFALFSIEPQRLLPEPTFSPLLAKAIPVTTVIFVLLSATIALGSRVDASSLHRFYRDRLIEAFMPSIASVRRRNRRLSAFADRLSLSEIDPAPERCIPYPLINTNLILVNDKSTRHHERGGDSFVLSPHFVGSSATGWVSTSVYENFNGPITLASAMTASGAAANANAGYVGTGVTRNRLVSLFMTLCNVRLGLWITNPYNFYKKPFFIRPNSVYTGLYCGLFNAGHKPNSYLVELSDGGHFDNLGIYELIRRRVEVIFAVDGEADHSMTFPGLISVLRRIEEDFPGVKIAIDQKDGLSRLIPHQTCSFPKGALHAQSSFFVARIKYPSTDTGPAFDGALIYCKATVLSDMDVTLGGHLAKFPSFPHQPTIDQFFDRERFECYRRLGYECTLRMIDTLSLADTLDDPRNILATYNRST